MAVMSVNHFSRIFLLQMLLFGQCSAAVVTTRDRLYAHIQKDYNSKTFPVINPQTTVQIGMECFFVSLNQFDEISGELAISMFFLMTWKEERISWNASEFDELKSIIVSPHDIWRPSFFIIQSRNKMQEIGNISIFLRVFSNGDVIWNPADEFKLSCSVDVTYFPFDKQLCIIEFIGIVYDPSEVVLYSHTQVLNLTYLTNNSQWEVMPSEVKPCPPHRAPTGCIQVHLNLKRRSEFYIVYIIVPLVFLGILNNLVFVMPASSGERNSVAITTFLSFVVYMGIVNDVVPQSSDPISYLYLYLMFLMVYSSSIMFLCIVSYRIYCLEGQVPCLVKGVVILLRCRCLRYVAWRRVKEVQKIIPTLKAKLSGQVDTGATNGVAGDDTNIVGTNRMLVDRWETMEKREEEGRKKTGDITWFQVGRTFDICWVIVLYTVYFLCSGFMFFLLYNNLWLD